MNWSQYFKLKERQMHNFWAIFILLLLIISFFTWGYFHQCARDEAALVLIGNSSDSRASALTPVNESNSTWEIIDRSRGPLYTCYLKCRKCNLVSYYSGREEKAFDMALSAVLYVALIALAAYGISYARYSIWVAKAETKKPEEKQEEKKQA